MLPPPGGDDLVQPQRMLRESIWRAPLVPAALAFTAGIVLDRWMSISFVFSVLACGGFLVSFVIHRRDPRPFALLSLALAGVSLGAAYHHYRRDLWPADDIGNLATETARPIHLRGVLVEEPKRLPAPPRQPLVAQSREATTTTLVRVTHCFERGVPRAVSGKVRLTVSGKEGRLLPELHPGDVIEIHGQLSLFSGQYNPSEFDVAQHWYERGVHARVTVRESNPPVVLLEVGWRWSVSGWLGRVRGSAHDLLAGTIPDPRTAGLARALLLGEGAPLSSEDWNKYVLTGVVHVLAISGQHLVVVGLFLWQVSRLLGLRQRRAALLIAGVLLGYALLTGARPAALRAGVGACIVCGGIAAGRPILPANLLAFAWLVVVVVSPVDVVDRGNQLSFLAVAVLCWGVGWVEHERQDPLEVVVHQSRGFCSQLFLDVLGALWQSYRACFIVWLAVTPLVAFYSNTLAPVALLLGPPLTLLTSLALLAGFVLLGVGWISPWLAAGPAWIVHFCLAGCEGLVDLSLAYPIQVYVGELPLWWIAILYISILVFLTHEGCRERWRRAVPAFGVWLCLGLSLGSAPTATGELRCTFLAVGHGGAIVLALPDGRVVLYDVGSIRGPDVVARTIAPYLWSRKVQRIDEVILSHPDLDHYNGLPGILERFAVGRVLLSPTFAWKKSRDVQSTLELLERRGIPVETVAASDRLLGGGVSLSILHPPSHYINGNDNTRSIVVEVRHREHVILLTGDLESEGLSYFLKQPPRKVDVLMAPHHGSARVDGKALVAWCQPSLVVSCQTAPRSPGKAEVLYRQGRTEFWTTNEQGAITVRSGATGLFVETFRHEQRIRLGK